MPTPAVNGSGISSADFWAETTCCGCGEAIHRGDPRFLIFFAELGFGPGHPDYTDSVLDEDRKFSSEPDAPGREFGLLSNGSVALAICGPCSGNEEVLTIRNPWHEWREQAVADDPGGSVHAIPVSQINVHGGEFDNDFEVHNDGLDRPSDASAAARSDAEDRFVSTHISDAACGGLRPGKLTENDLRERMTRFLYANPSAMRGKMRQVCELWAQGRKQVDIERELHIDQSTVCRLIRSGKAML